MIGILPAAGSASRLYGLPKWALPIPGGYLLDRHIDEMLAAGCEPIHVGANDNNYSLLREYAPTEEVYIAERYETMTQTVMSATRYNDTVLFGMPDTYLPTGVYQHLAKSIAVGADVAVAVFRARPGQHRHGGMCRVHRKTFQVLEVVDKPEETDLMFIWGALAWQPAFWEYMQPNDPHVGYALPRAIADGLDVRAVNGEGGYYDCGTIEGYYEALTAMLNLKVSEQAQ